MARHITKNTASASHRMCAAAQTILSDGQMIRAAADGIACGARDSIATCDSTHQQGVGRGFAFFNHSRRIPMKIRPLHDRVMVRRLEEERKTASGIVIPDTAAEKPDQGEVTAVGNGKVLEDGKVRPLDVKVGDRILFGKYSGQTVKVQGDELLVMREEDIMGVVEGK
jgi:chaperonin GroES